MKSGERMSEISKNGPKETRLYGRKVIYADYLPEEMNEQTITKILTDVFSVHLSNANQIDYLEKYYFQESLKG